MEGDTPLCGPKPVLGSVEPKKNVDDFMSHD